MEEKVDALESHLLLLTERMDSYISQSNDTDHSDVSAHGHDNGMATSVPGSRQDFPLILDAVFSHDLRYGSHHSGAPSVTSVDQMPLNLSPGLLDPGFQDAALEQHQLPPYRILSCLVDSFFKHIITWAPLLTRKTVDEILSAPWLAEDDAALLHGIVATTIRYSDDATLNHNNRAQYYDTSTRVVKNSALYAVGIRPVQALVLVTLDMLGDSDCSEGRRLLSLLGQILIHMDLGRERSVFLEPRIHHRTGRFDSTALTRPTSWSEEEERRRLVWTVYMLDRYATIGTHRRFGIPDSALDLAFPCRYDAFCNNQIAETKRFRGCLVAEGNDINQECGSFTYHCELLVILSKIHNLVERPVDLESEDQVQTWRRRYLLLDNALHTWLSSLPEHATISQLCHQNPAARVSNWIMLQAAFLLGSILLNSAAAYPVQESQYFRYSNNARRRCLAAVDSLRRITLDMTQVGALQCLGYPYAFVLWTCAGVLLVHAAAKGTKVDQAIWFFINALDSQARFWPIATHYSTILRTVLHRGERDDQESTSILAHSGQTFTAMRRRATELHDILRQTRSSINEPMTAHTVDKNDIELLELFGLFHYPLDNSGGSRESPSDTATELVDLDEAEALSYGSKWQPPARDKSWTADSESGDISTTPDQQADWLDQHSAYDLRTIYF